MLDFRKVLLATVAGLGLVATASAQVAPTCSATPGPVGYVALEGTTEQVPQLSLSCTTAGGTAFNAAFNVTLTGSVNFANQIPTGSRALDITVSDANGADAYTGATATAPAANQILLTWSNVNVLAANMPFVITISGIRVNASGSAGAGTTITVTPTSSTAAISSAAPVWNAAFVTKSISSTIANTAPAGITLSHTTLDPANNTLCGQTGSASAPNTTVYNVNNTIITAGFLDALKNVVDVNGVGNALTAATYGTNALAGSTAATVGSVLAVTYSNLIASGVTYFAPTVIVGANVTLTAYLAQPTNLTTATPAPAYAGTGAAALLTNSQAIWSPVYAAGPPVVIGGTYGGLLAAVPANQFALPGGSTSATIFYAVTASSAASTQQALISLMANAPVPSSVLAFNTTPISASISLVGAAAPAYPGISATATAYTAAPSSLNASNGLISACSTTLLFPYLTSTSGFDTGVAIVNASTGVGATAATGTCTLTLYGTGGTGTVTTPFTWTTPASLGAVSSTVATQTPLAAFDLNSVDAGFTGYGVAVCNFVGAHGYAFLFNSGGLSGNYLAPVIASGSDAYTPSNGTAIIPTF